MHLLCQYKTEKKVVTEVDYDLSVCYTVTAACHKPNILTVIWLPRQNVFNVGFVEC